MPSGDRITIEPVLDLGAQTRLAPRISSVNETAQTDHVSIFIQIQTVEGIAAGSAIAGVDGAGEHRPAGQDRARG